MLFFGHIGFTLGVFLVFFFIVKWRVDYRLVILGSLLPDIIDKPLSVSVFGGLLGSGRYLGHTLTFALLLAGIFLLFYKNPKLAGLIVLPVAIFFHDLEDRMWTNPKIFYWPFISTNPHFAVSQTLVNESVIQRAIVYESTIVRSNAFDLYTYGTELIGLLVLLLFIYHYKLYRLDRLNAFILKGTLSSA